MRISALLTLVFSAVTALTASAQTDDTRRPSHCIAIADANPWMQYVHKASWTDPVPEFSVRLHYISHASFLLQTQGGLNAVTDFTGFIGNTTLIPDVVTMNHAHDTHWTANPDPAIPHPLNGWGEFGEGIDHYLDLGEMLVRNVSTDIRSGFGGVEENGNSIFVFEVEGLCIGHLGHLHHEPNDEQYAALGRLDVLMVPVDGGFTMERAAMIRVIERLKSRIIIPMHWFSGMALTSFLNDVSDEFVILRDGRSSLEVSLATLPDRPTIIVLEPQWLSD